MSRHVNGQSMRQTKYTKNPEIASSSQPSEIELYTFRGKGPCFTSSYPQHLAQCPLVNIRGVELIVEFSMGLSTQ